MVIIILKTLSKIGFITVLFFLVGCSQEKNTFVSKQYHNTTAHYNSYFLALENMKLAEQSISKKTLENFNRQLPALPLVSDDIRTSIAANLEEVIKKASLAIQRHKNSKWVDNSYVLIGKSRFYKQDYENAIVTFKFVNSKYTEEEDKNEALIWLMRSFTMLEQYDNALTVHNNLVKKTFNKKNIELFNLASAELYQTIGDKNSVIKNIEIAAKNYSNRYFNARTHFLLAQIMQENNKNEDAYLAYKIAARKSPTYEMSFFAKLYMAQVSNLEDEGNVKKTLKYFKKLLRDEKNIDYKDKIYYEIAKFYRKQNNYNTALSNVKFSVKSPSPNPNQKAYSYLLGAEIYYENLKNYKKSKLYYDSTLMSLAKNDPDYERIEKRAKVLEEFVKNLNTIQREDSLQKLAKMDSINLYAFLDSSIIAKEEIERKERERKEELAKEMLNNQNTNSNNLSQNNLNGSNWYFNNPNSVSKGTSEFVRIWGRRPLEDNWRRKNKESQFVSEEENDKENENKIDDESTTSSIEEKRKLKLEKLLTTIPFSEEQLAKSNMKIEKAYYKLGEIYHLQLFEYQFASESYEKLNERYPNHEKYVEVLYKLYLVNKEINPEKSAYYKNLLLTEYPNSIYAKLAEDPEYLVKNAYINKEVEQLYATAYEDFEKRFYQKSITTCEKIINQYPKNEILDKVIFLSIVSKARIDSSLVTYKQNLEKFLVDFKTSELKPTAEEYLKMVNDFMNNAISNNNEKDENKVVEEKFPFIDSFNDVHYYIGVFDTRSQSYNKVLAKYSDFNITNFSSDKLTVKQMLLSSEKYLVVIKKFDNKQLAMNYYNSLNVEKDILNEIPVKTFDSFVISESNFPIFYQQKNTDIYSKYFRKKYL